MRKFFFMLEKRKEIELYKFKLLAHLIQGGKIEEPEELPLDYDPFEGVHF